MVEHLRKRESLRRTLIKVEREWADMAARWDTEIFAFEVVIALTTFFVHKVLRDDVGIFLNRRLDARPLLIARPSKPKLIGAAPCRRNHNKSRIWAARPHRTQGCDQIGRKTGCFIGNDPASDRKPAYRIVGCGQRAYA